MKKIIATVLILGCGMTTTITTYAQKCLDNYNGEKFQYVVVTEDKNSNPENPVRSATCFYTHDKQYTVHLVGNQKLRWDSGWHTRHWPSCNDHATTSLVNNSSDANF